MLNLTAEDRATSNIEMQNLGANGRYKSKHGASRHKDSTWSLIRFAAGFNRPERGFSVWAIICCSFAGAEEAVNAVLFGMSSISLAVTDPNKMLSQVAEWAWIYLGFALVQLIIFCGQGILLAILSERMIRRVKQFTFRNALRQDIEFYDADESSSSNMVSLLSTGTNDMCGLSGATLGSLMVVFSTLLVSIAIGLGFSWRLALVCTATIPFVLGCGYLSVAFLGKHSAAMSANTQAAANQACEALADMKTIAILTKEKEVLAQYCDALEELKKKSLVKNIVVSLVYALCQSVIYLCMALGFWYGATLIVEGKLSSLGFFVAFTSVIFGARSAGYFFSFADDISKAIKGTQCVKSLFHRKVKIDPCDTSGMRILGDAMGGVQFEKVCFHYPGHDHPVLIHLSFSVMPDEQVAIVGPSGCGKSSIISLLERFYNPDSGTIFFDGTDISFFRLDDYRNQMSLVSQDIALYEGTIRENICLGVNERPGRRFDAKLEIAIDIAHLKQWIDSLPDGLSTRIGSKGSQLSGGQKQRISIARAILRDPKVLLLDEATSALDVESEREVQTALNAASRGRTTITIAHRLNTVRNADRIYFMECGRFTEVGTHDQLMAKKGRYAEFVVLQRMINAEGGVLKP